MAVSLKIIKNSLRISNFSKLEQSEFAVEHVSKEFFGRDGLGLGVEWNAAITRVSQKDEGVLLFLK